MRTLIMVLGICLLGAQSLLADYALPPVEERLVLLVNLKDVKLDNSGLALSLGKTTKTFGVEGFWIQHHVWSDGICTGIKGSDPKSALTRIRQVQSAIKEKQDGLLLLELIKVRKGKVFQVTYLKLFAPAKEYKRYYPKREFYDTIEMPFDSIPSDSKEFVKALEKITSTAKERLLKIK